MTVLSQLMNLADAEPDALALLEPVGEKPVGESLVGGTPVGENLVPVSRRELVDRVFALRGDLAAHGFGVGDCAAVWLPNWSSAVEWQLAVGSLGGHVIGINTRYNVHEVTHVLNLARPRVVALAEGFVGLDLIGRLRESVAAVEASAEVDESWTAPQVVPLTGPGLPAVADISRFDVGSGAWLPGGAPPLDVATLAEPSTDELYLAVTTSGSTGLPKLAAHKQSGTLEQLLAAGRTAMRVAPSDRLVAALPFSGTFGFVAAFGMLLAGGSIIMHPSFDPAAVVRHVVDDGATHLAFGDDMMTRVIEQAQQVSADGADLSALTWVGIADFQGAARGLAEWIETNTPAKVTGLYGSSETFALLNVSPPEYFDAPDRWLPGGRLVPDSLQYRIADGERVITDGSEGEIQFQGPQVVDEYLGQPHQMAANFTADGWLRSGDLGRAIDERSFRFVCRAAEALRLKGFLVEPDEIANHLLTHPAVEIAKVVGVRRDAGDEAVGFVTVKDGGVVTGDELVEHCRTALARYKVPTAVFVIDDMPVTAGTNGTKIRAKVLQEWAAERLS